MSCRGLKPNGRFNRRASPCLERAWAVKGRCGACAYLLICNGNTRVRAQQMTGDAWAEDPGCYLTDEEIGL